MRLKNEDFYNKINNKLIDDNLIDDEIIHMDENNFEKNKVI